jgi:MoaA/NifB/PqqE/SkfB family radical SAM enzyme
VSVTSSDTYSPHKALRYPDRLRVLAAGGVSTPVHVQIILSDLCNQACDFCAYRDPSYSSSQMFYELNTKAGLRRAEYPERNYNPHRMIPYQKVIEILEDCVAMGVEAIQYTGGGEPTVHPAFVAIMAETRRLGLKYAVVTNGVIAGQRKPVLDALAGAEWVRVSIDAGTETTYTTMRHAPASHWEAAWSAVEQLRGRTHLGVGFVVTPQNWQEMWDCTSRAVRDGADNIRLSAQFSAEDERLFAACHTEAARLARECEQWASDVFSVHNRFSARLDDLRQRSPDYERCGYQEFTTYVGGDLNVYRCCVQAYNERGLIGSLREQRFQSLWLSSERADAMRVFNARDCDRCQFNAINRTLDYALRSDAPMHHAFV